MRGLWGCNEAGFSAFASLLFELVHLLKRIDRRCKVTILHRQGLDVCDAQCSGAAVRKSEPFLLPLWLQATLIG